MFEGENNVSKAEMGLLFLVASYAGSQVGSRLRRRAERKKQKAKKRRIFKKKK